MIQNLFKNIRFILYKNSRVKNGHFLKNMLRVRILLCWGIFCRNIGEFAKVDGRN